MEKLIINGHYKTRNGSPGKLINVMESRINPKYDIATLEMQDGVTITALTSEIFPAECRVDVLPYIDSDPLTPIEVENSDENEIFYCGNCGNHYHDKYYGVSEINDPAFGVIKNVCIGCVAVILCEI
jgi:hypothetical protein